MNFSLLYNNRIIKSNLALTLKVAIFYGSYIIKKKVTYILIQ